MIANLLIIIPLAGALIAPVWPNERSRPWLSPVAAAAHLILSLRLLFEPPSLAPGAWLGFDAVTRAVLPAVSLLFFVCACYSVSYLRAWRERPNRVFISMLLAILGLLSAALQARHLGLLWIATEAVTLAAVPLLHFNNTPRAFEATWKYLLVGGTGIALSLLGSFCLGYASLHGGGRGDLTLAALAAHGGDLSRPWVLTAWVLLLVGYGTKMGLAPMHTWKPDAYGEAPSIIGAILAGGIATAAFTAILRVRAVVAASGAGAITDQTLLCMGLFSMMVAAVFLFGTRDFKRMLAYSSVEKMGVLCIGAGLGGAGMFAALFHIWGNSFAKGALFLSAGNLNRAAGARTMDTVRGMSRLAPRSAFTFVSGLFAITALPPFAPFFSELRVLRAAFESGRGLVAAIFLICVLFAFFGLTRVVFAIIDGRPGTAVKTSASRFPERAGLFLPPVALLVVCGVLGVATPAVLLDSWRQAVAQLTP
jgi:hydrogenase-4 component F